MDPSGQRPEFSQATGMVLVPCILGKILEVACHCFPPLFLDVPTFHHQVPPRPQWRERSQRRKWELWARMLSGNFAEMTTSTPSTTWDRRLYFPSEGRRAEDFFALKNPTASAGFEPANLGTKGQHAIGVRLLFQVFFSLLKSWKQFSLKKNWPCNEINLLTIFFSPWKFLFNTVGRVKLEGTLNSK